MAKTLIVDGNSLLFRSYYSTAYTGNLMTNKDGIPTNAVFAFHNLIKKIKAMAKAGDHIYITFDTGEPTFRKQEFQDYKAQRAPCPQELLIQMPIARELLDAMDISWKELKGYEGDDLAGSMARYAASQGDEVTLFTSDKDFLQLLDLGEKVHVCFLKKGLTETVDYTKANLHDLFGLNPDQITDFKGIAGDPSDNYGGIKGVGEKTTMKLLNEYGHLEDILKYCEANQKPKVNQKILEGAKEAEFFKKLATIETNLAMEEDYQKASYTPYHKSKLSKFYAKYQLAQFMNAIDKMHDITDDTDDQMSLFADYEKDIPEEEQTQLTEREHLKIASFSEIKEPVLAMVIDDSSDNENTAEIYSFAFATKGKVYLLSHKDALHDASFHTWLEEDKKDLAVFDIKGMQVLLTRHGYPKIKGVTFDLLLATYLINPDSGQKVEELFSTAYNLYLNLNKNLAAQIVSFVADLRKSVMETIQDHQEEKLLNDVEMPLANLLADMELEGFPIDRDTLLDINDDYTKTLYSLEQEVYRLAGKEFNINSPKQVEQVLFEDLGIVRYKGEKGTGIEVLRSHYNHHPIVPVLIEYRMYSKLVNSYTSALPAHIFEDGKFHSIYNQALTATGRLSMAEPNLQQISIRNEEGKALRKAFFYPNHEYYILSLDYSQIELRMLAHVANIKALKEIFEQGQDIHRATAAKVFNVPFEEVTSEMRRRAKAVNFGIVYGISPYGLATQLEIDPKEAATLISQFKQAFEGIDEFQKACVEKARRDGYVSTIMNRRRYLKDINAKNFALRSFSERAATNTVIQGSAADLIKVAMIKCADLLKHYQTKIVLQIHDELIFKVPKDELETVLPLLKEAMDSALPLSVPLEVDGTAALTWYEAH